MHSQLYLPTCTHTCSCRHLYLHSCTQTSGCIKGPLFSLPVVFVAFVRNKNHGKPNMAQRTLRICRRVCEQSRTIATVDTLRDVDVDRRRVEERPRTRDFCSNRRRANSGGDCQSDESPAGGPAQFMSECQRDSHASAKAFVSHTAAILGGRHKQPKVKENGHTSLGRPRRHRYGAV